MLDHHHAGRDILELLTDLLADADAKGAAVGTGKQFGGDVVDLAAAEQVLGQRLAAVTGLLGRRWLGGRCSLLGWSGGGFAGGRGVVPSRLEELASKEQELVGVELLRLAAVDPSQELLELMLELLDEAALSAHGLEQLGDELVGRLQVGGQFVGRLRHTINTGYRPHWDDRFLEFHEIRCARLVTRWPWRQGA